MSSDEVTLDLIQRAAAGEQKALERLLLAYYNRLIRRISRKLPIPMRSVITEEDILQQAFIDAFQGIGLLEPRGERAFYRWLVRIADRRLQDAIKSHFAAKRGGGRADARWACVDSGDSTVDLIELLAGPQHTPSQSAARHEAVAAVQLSLASLNTDYQRVIRLRYIEGLAVADVAKAMDRTEHAVHNLCYRALRELRAVLGRSSQFLSRK